MTEPTTPSPSRELIETLAERARWYRDGCDGLEDREGYYSSGDVARDAASDLETALSEIRVLERVIALMRGHRPLTASDVANISRSDLKQAQGAACSLHCPSVKQTGEPWTHVPLCQSLLAALAGETPAALERAKECARADGCVTPASCRSERVCPDAGGPSGISPLPTRKAAGETPAAQAQGNHNSTCSNTYVPAPCDGCVCLGSPLPAREALAQVEALAEHWAEQSENAKFAAALRGPSDDEPKMPYVRLFVEELDLLVIALRELAALSSPSPSGTEQK